MPGYTGKAQRGSDECSGCFEVFWLGGLTCSSNAPRDAVRKCKSAGWYVWRIDGAGRPTSDPIGPFDTSKDAAQVIYRQ